ncbi:hypothetical protein L1987_18344 [Smallanthus sonchifolius]|uniref:Uncharacterized protein n=1 Tax=Smallanthus sonchifolius TaxID=185202 RepID=A0ACB9J1N3_9ASTR|nr:hypothetical protein L1987_18344 [Smallanthus sonchifolius]
MKVEITPTTKNLHVKQEPLDKKPLKLEGTVHEDLPPLDVKYVLAVQQSIISENHSPPHVFLFCWANHNPWEDEMSTDSDYNPWEDEFSVVSD